MAVEPSAQIGYQLVPAPHSSVAVRNRQRRDGARLTRAPWNKWKGPAPAQCNAAGVGSGPFMPRKGLAIGRAALRFAPEAADERRGEAVAATKDPGRARTRAAPLTRPLGRAGRRRISDGNHRRMAHNAYVQFKPSGGPSWASFAFLAHAPQGPRRASAGRQHDRQSNELSPGYWMFRWRRRKLGPDGRSQYLRGQ